MSPRQILNDVARFLRATAAPLITLGVLALVRTAGGAGASPTGVDELVLVASRAALIATLLWLLITAIWAATGPLRDRRAFQQLQRLREMATSLDHALVHVQTIVWSSAAGQHVVVVNVATGVTSHVWLPETTVPIGSYIVVERADNGVRVIDHLGANSVEAAHRSEGRSHHVRSSDAHPTPPPTGREEPDTVTLIAEVEEYLRRR